MSRLWELLRVRGNNPRLFALRERPYDLITPHLLLNRTSESNSYVLLSESGKALVIDFGYDFNIGLASGTDRASRRPWLYTLTALKVHHGVTAFDVVLPTHYHDDHVAGINLLRRVEGAKVWVPVSLVTPDGWQAHPATLRGTLEACAHLIMRFTLQVPPGTAGRRLRIAADLSVDGVRFGQQAEALVTVQANTV